MVKEKKKEGKNGISRKQFLKTTGIIGGSAVIAGMGLGSAKGGISSSTDKIRLPALRKAAARRYKRLTQGMQMAMPEMAPGQTPHYFGPYPNYANSPLPKGKVVSGFASKLILL